jgi:hypothetical protein
MKKKEMVRVYRKSSPRTGRQYDFRMILAQDIRYYKNRGWKLEMPKPKDDDEDDDELIPPSMLNKAQIEEIRNDPLPQRKLAKKYNISTFTAHKIKAGKL